MRSQTQYPFEEEVVAIETDSQRAVCVGNGTEGWMASMYDVGDKNHRRAVIELHNETMVDRASLEMMEFESLLGKEMSVEAVIRQFQEKA